MPNIWLRRLRRLIGKVVEQPNELLYGPIVYTEDAVNMSGLETQDYIYEHIMSKQPLLVTRFGSTEMTSLMDSSNQWSIRNLVRYLLNQSDTIGYHPWTLSNMEQYSGFYPSTAQNNLRYYKLILDVLGDIDLVGSWMLQENIFLTKDNKWGGVKRCRLSDLESFRFSNPWSAALEGKKVLVIHPFEATIRHQYEKNRERLFADKRVLPEFELITIKAVQSIAGNRPDGFPTWFDALEWMEKEIDETEFDVAILGCGAYGMPLAGYIKKKGKIAIHMGGATQYLFGIRSKRADDAIPEVRALYNDYWIRPFSEDRPKGAELVENGCYW